MKPEFGQALEALLGSAVEAISVADLSVARQILAHLEEQKIGSACLQVAEAGNRISESPAAGLPPFLQPATIALANLDPAHPIVGLLAACYIAENLDAFLEFWRANPAFPFLLVATPKGELVDRRGLIYGGHQRKPAGGIVQREIDLRETARELAREQKLHDEQRALIDKLGAALAAAEAVLEQRRKHVLAATQQVAAVQAEARNADKTSEEVAGRLERMERELAGLEQARIEAEQRLIRAQAGLAEAEERVAAQRQAILALENQIAALRADRDQKKEALAQARLELAERRQKVEVLDRGLGEMERRRAQIGELLAQRQQEVEVWTEQAAELEQESAAQLAGAGEIARTLVVAQESVEKIRGELVELERQIAAIEEEPAEPARADRCHAGGARPRRGKAGREPFAGPVPRRGGAARISNRPRHGELEAPALARRGRPAGSQAARSGRGRRGGASRAETGKRPEAASQSRSRRRAAPKPKTQNATQAKKQKGEPTEADLAALDQTNWEEIKAGIEALRQRLNSMGAVNLVAIEEYAELRQRYDFLRTQSDDLTNAKAAAPQGHRRDQPHLAKAVRSHLRADPEEL